MTQNHLQDFWQLRVISALVMSGAIVASSGGYAFAQRQQPCLPGQPCTPIIRIPNPHPGHPGAIPPFELQQINKLNPQAIEQLQREDPQAIQKLRQGDQATLNRLQQLAPNYRQQLQQSAPINQVR
ncbi:MAG: hypothetical protein ACR2LR_20385 [Hassallia sp.]